MGLYTGVYKIDNSSCKESFRVGRTYILSKDVSSNLSETDVLIFGPEFVGRIEEIVDEIDEKRIFFCLIFLLIAYCNNKAYLTAYE